MIYYSLSVLYWYKRLLNHLFLEDIDGYKVLQIGENIGTKFEYITVKQTGLLSIYSWRKINWK